MAEPSSGGLFEEIVRTRSSLCHPRTSGGFLCSRTAASTAARHTGHFRAYATDLSAATGNSGSPADSGATSRAKSK